MLKTLTQVDTDGKTMQIAVRGYLIALMIILAGTGLLLIRTGRDWGYGDWMINYQGGFVRRGLVGQLCFILGKTFHIDLLYFVAALAISCYAILFFSVWHLLARSSWSWWVIALLVSPVTLAFPVVSRSSFRKEILYFAILGLLILWLRRHGADRSKDVVLSVCLAIAFPVLILSHEPLFAYLPYCVAALLICMDDSLRGVKVLVAPLLLAALAMLLAVTYIGDASTVESICASLSYPSISSCSEAVKVLAQNRNDGLEKVALFVSTFHYFRNYGVGLVLALIPVVGGLRAMYRAPGARRNVILLTAAICIASLLSVSLFRYGVDWGRWIYIHLVSISLLLLLVDERRRDGAYGPRQPNQRPSLNTFAGLLLVLYALCWSIPGVGDKPLFGYVSLAGRIAHWHQASGSE